ncbi:unnamed protein product [Triticum turgidum subsp. durum]|uniref:DNA (cytosine-5)-methyltransferase n=3 Tax=Triticum TaxID=4564 RepID=A0A9R0XKJ8_TRITD|nr:unnamed protein product [Triticum turgidum subsp. durum]
MMIAETSRGIMSNSPYSAGTAGTKRRQAKPKSDNENIIEESNVTTNIGHDTIGCKRTKREVARSNFNEKAFDLLEEDSLVTTKEIRTEEEAEAVRLTRTGPEDGKCCRKLIDFILHGKDDNLQPFEMSQSDGVSMTALVMPFDAHIEKDRKKGIRCVKFGRIKGWAVSGYKEGAAVISLSTELADYICVKATRSYRSHFDLFSQKAHVCVEVYRELARSVGGNPLLSLEELLAGVVSSINLSSGFNGRVRKEFVISIGEFVHNQLTALDHAANNDDEMLLTLPALVALRNECKSNVGFSKLAALASHETLMIKDGRCKEVQVTENEDEEEKLARLLQEVEEWNMKKPRAKSGSSQKIKNAYIKISEAEIANDYPLPAYYTPCDIEKDEYMFGSEDGMLPVRILNNWALYNSDFKFMSLELIPMEPGAKNDTVIFGSGCMRDDDGTFCSTAEPAELSSSSSKSDQEDQGIPVYLSPIKEWLVESCGSMICISIQTDIACYKLLQPTKQYAPWCATVLKTARLTVSIIAILKEQTRASKLSFADVTKRVAEFESGHHAFISTDATLVERYVVVHGQIVLQQFANYTDESIRRCAFVTGLIKKMKERGQMKLATKKKSQAARGENLNPSAKMARISKQNLMRATTTKLVSRIWDDYDATHFPEDSKEGGENDEQKVFEEEQEENEEDDVEGVVEVGEGHVSRTSPSTRSRNTSSDACEEIEWKGQTVGKTPSGEALYRSVRFGDLSVAVGGALTLDGHSGEAIMCFVEYMYETHDGTQMIHGRVLQNGSDTVLGNAANEREVFFTNDCLESKVGDMRESLTVNVQQIPWGHKCRKEQLEAIRVERARAEERKKKGLPLEYICKSMYCPEKGAFFSLPYEKMGAGTGTCSSCEERQAVRDEFKILSETSFVLKNVKYNVHDFLYIRPQFFSPVEGRGTYRARRNVGLKPYVVCRLQSVNAAAGSRKANLKSTKVSVRRLYRPDDISSDKAYSSDIREVYYSEDIVSVPVGMIEGKCEVTAKDDLPNSNLPVVVEHAFYCEHLYDPGTETLKQLPTNVKLTLARKAPASRKNKGKQICDDEQAGSDKHKDETQENCLATLDIFAGCGGLSEGLHLAGASRTKWAIEYEEPAAQAFLQNHPEAAVFVENCNVILKAIMDKCGDVDDCVSTPEASAGAAELSDEKVKNLPVPGEVEFINGGPPCQGFSWMNRFKQSPWSKVQCEMIPAFLSFAEYFRPRFFLLENVRNFVSFNKGQTFRLTLASLLEMGYQVRFGILEAGAYGVAQSRKRAFIWAAAPGETLPDWPEPMHVFASPELKIKLPGGKYYAAARSTAGGAPFRSMTVRDTIGDLPPVENGASNPTIKYGGEPISWFQKKIRGDTLSLSDHISKKMNELNLIRCKHIPKRPGCDWHDLPDEKVKLSRGKTVDLIPRCMLKTAKTNNQWKGLCGRLDWEGNFPTSVTDPQPMRRVGMCFHPDQDRIITVRECARSQGFPDGYHFAGNIQSKHRQIGNAVPPPLAYALGRKLKQAIDAKLPKLTEDMIQVGLNLQLGPI